MQNVIPIKIQNNQSAVMHATVKNVSDANVIIETELGIMNALVAFSCFIRPEVNDLVLVDYNDQQCFILSVLERTASADINLQYPTNVRMAIADGDLNISAKDDMRFSAGGKSTFVSDETSFISNTLNVISDVIKNRSVQIESHVGTLRLFSDSIDTVAKQIKQRADSLIRWVDGLESSSIGNLIQNVRHTHTSHSSQAVITAKKDIRMDAERIHMG